MKININERIGVENYNNQGCLMKVVEYYASNNIIVEFQDKFKTRVSSTWRYFSTGSIRNPYFPTVCGVGITGNKYPAKTSGKNEKEYQTWRDMLRRCYDEKTQNKQPTYKNCTVCDQWLYYPNFYDWIHSQENFDKWYNTSEKWTIDKDIIHKGNRIYSPDNCCLVHNDINVLFTKDNQSRGDLPIGVTKNPKNDGEYVVRCSDGNNHNIFLGHFKDPKDGFIAYKNKKEEIIKRIASEEFSKGNITKRCYDAMMTYEIEISD
jgi:hypothetical protein